MQTKKSNRKFKIIQTAEKKNKKDDPGIEYREARLTYGGRRRRGPSRYSHGTPNPRHIPDGMVASVHPSGRCLPLQIYTISFVRENESIFYPRAEYKGAPPLRRWVLMVDGRAFIWAQMWPVFLGRVVFGIAMRDGTPQAA